MKFNPFTCPECGKVASGSLETLRGVALLNIDTDTGEAEYEGTTEIWWNDQKTIQDSQGRYLLTCENGHEWPAELKPPTRSDDLDAASPCWVREPKPTMT